MKNKSNFAMHGATVSLTPARAVTSHVRRHYERRYKGRYRFAPWVFLFDVGCVAVILVLFGYYVFLISRPMPPPGLRLVLSAPPIVSASPLALEATVISRDEQARDQVKLTWELPPNTEILLASPPLTEEREVFLGALKAGETKSARLVVRFFVPPGSVKVGFRVQDTVERLIGSETRPVVRSGLRLESLLRPTALVPGARLPFLVKNDTSYPLEGTQLVLGGGAHVDGKTALSLGTFAPFESKALLVDPVDATFIRVQALVRAVPVSEITMPLVYSSGALPLEKLVLHPSTPGNETWVEVETRKSVRLLVFHPALQGADAGVRMFDLGVGPQKISLPLLREFSSVTPNWFAIPFVQEAGKVVIGIPVQAVVTTPFHLNVMVRYYAASGDQIGVGPLPPRTGETTKFWVSWKLGATTADLSNLTVRAALPPSVSLTGREALPYGGTIAYENGEVVWRVPFMAASNEGVTANFEIAFTPTSRMKGSVPMLLQSTRATAIENRTQTHLSTTAQSLETNLLGDQRGQGNGRVR